jgi:hypothetical protein
MTVTIIGDARRKAPWLFLIFQLPARKASARVSVWRKLQKYGALAWKNAAYILPHNAGNLEKFQWLAAEVRKHHGEASIAEVLRIEGHTERQMIALFNQARQRDYETLIGELRFALRPSGRSGRNNRRDLLARVNRRLAEIAALDVFGCGKRKEAERLIKEMESQHRLGTAEDAPIRRQQVREFRGRVWMTRPRPEVDRVASAWLIRRFIDPRARFVFSPDPNDHPGALRFDMFEGEFTHFGDDCTMETLLKFFGLRDKRLRAIAQIVHDADLEDNKFRSAEGRAVDFTLKGWGKMKWADMKILRRGFELFDALYLTLGN